MIDGHFCALINRYQKQIWLLTLENCGYGLACSFHKPRPAYKTIVSLYPFCYTSRTCFYIFSFLVIFLLFLKIIISAVCLHFDQLRWSFNYFCSMTRKYFPDAQTFLPQCILERIYKEKNHYYCCAFFQKNPNLYRLCCWCIFLRLWYDVVILMFLCT